MCIEYQVLGFEPTTSWTQVVIALKLKKNYFIFTLTTELGRLGKTFPRFKCFVSTVG